LLNLPPARVWIYRQPGSPMVVRGPQPLIMKLKQRTGKVRKDILETADRFEDRIRRGTLQARQTIEVQRLRMTNEPAFRPVLNLLRKFGEKKPRG
jgi:hypothetical protein